LRKIIFLLLFLILTPSFAKTTVYLFYGSGCPHCTEERDYLKGLLESIDLEVEEYEVWYNTSNRELYENFSLAYNTINDGSVPRLFIGDKVFIGFDTNNGELAYSQRYKAYIGFNNVIYDEVLNCVNKGCLDPLDVVDPTIITNKTSEDVMISELKEVELPFLGTVNIADTSILFLTIFIGLLDGFNPCAMWMLSFLLAFVIATRSRKKVFIVGGIFILVSGLVYFLFITAWLNLFISMSAITFLRIIAGSFALFAGIINIKDFFAFQKGFSLTIPKRWQPGIKKRMKLVSKASGIGMIIGVIILAFTINLVELLCTIGFPVIYLNILAQQELPALINYLYVGLYVLMYMFDDAMIFLAAVFTLSHFDMDKKKVRYLKLFSGIMIIILALILMIKPDLLMFG